MGHSFGYGFKALKDIRSFLLFAGLSQSTSKTYPYHRPSFTRIQALLDMSFVARMISAVSLS
jgi:hypothetical protein